MSSTQADATPAPASDPPGVGSEADAPVTSPDVATAEAQADRARFGYQPALDGLRAVAVLGVLFYHGTVGWALGGFLGVDVFFTLSGYLITTLLLMERDATTRVDLKGFWIRRARRLLPALFLVLVAVAFYAAFSADSLELPSIRGDGIASLFYVANWRFIASGQSYFAQFVAPSPLRHMWSLAIEEQWYLFWPIIFTAGYKFTKFRDRSWAIGLLVFAALSAGLMAVLYGLNPGADPSRIYYGTDTRAQPLLIGAALAFALHRADLSKLPRWVLQALGLVGLAGVFSMFGLVTDSQGWMYRGGFTVIAVATVMVITVMMQPGASIAKSILAFGPLPLIGRMSYGLYIWHWPIYVYLDSTRTGLSGAPLMALRLLVTGIVATLSYNLVEMPVRHGALRRLAARLSPRSPGIVVVAAGAMVAILLAGMLVVTTSTPSDAQQGVVNKGDLKTMLVGDSVMYTLGLGFSKDDAPGIALQNSSIVGCGITRAERRPLTHPSQLTTQCKARLDSWKADVGSFGPKVSVMSLGQFEVFNLSADGKDYEFRTPEFAKYIRTELDNDLNVLTADGGKVVLLTASCFNLKMANGTDAAPESVDPTRLPWLNDIGLSWAKKNRRKVKVVDLRGYLCPDDQFQEKLNGVELYRDGEHFTPEGAAEVWKWLGPEIRKAINGT